MLLHLVQPLQEHGPDEAALLLLEEDPEYDGSEAGTRPLPLREPAWHEVEAELRALCGAAPDDEPVTRPLWEPQAVDIDVSDLGYRTLPVEKGGLP